VWELNLALKKQNDGHKIILSFSLSKKWHLETGLTLNSTQYARGSFWGVLQHLNWPIVLETYYHKAKHPIALLKADAPR
jgi:hypothetical protein